MNNAESFTMGVTWEPPEVQLQDFTVNFASHVLMFAANE